LKKLRDYQQEVVDKILAAWLHVLNVLAVVPTGGGKTVIFCHLIALHVGAAVAVVHRKEILAQISVSLAEFGVKHRVIAPASTVSMIRKRHLKKLGRSFIDPQAVVGVASVQTLASKSTQKNPQLMRWLAQVTLAVFDEGHHYVRTGSWAKAVNLLAKAKKLFVTATPERADGKGLGAHEDGFAEVMVEGPQTHWLIKNGYLTPFKYRAPQTDLDMSDLPITATGDVSSKVLRQRTVESHLVGDVVDSYLRYDDTRGRKAIVFASDVETAEELARKFVSKGVKAQSLDGTTEAGVRERAIDDFSHGDTQVLVNVDLFDEGFDVPGVEVAIVARVTMSLAKYLQMVGRALRLMDGKEYAVIIDPVKNWERHGMPNWPRKWTLGGSGGGGGGGPRDTVAQRSCLQCTQPYEVFYKQCPTCGAPPPAPAGRARPEQVDGDLFELDVEGMAAMFEAIEKANMTPEQFELDMIKRRVPSIGRQKDMRAHKAVLYRRSVLKELMGWWFGLQPSDRSLQEKQRRFYARFGVDAGYAMTLDAAKTDKLIEEIQRRFNEDFIL